MKRRVRQPREIVVSHATADHVFVNKLVRWIRALGVRCWYSRHHLKAADRWQDEIGRALKRCDWFIVVLSKPATKSMWVRRELQFALRQPRLAGRIIPVYAKSCDPSRLSWTLEDFQFVDFRTKFERGAAELERILPGLRPSREAPKKEVR